MHMKKKIILLQLLLIAVIAVAMMAGCKKNKYTLSTTEDVNITGFIDKSPDSFSLFREILEVTGSSSFLNAYGDYTCFVVTNQGVKRWMDSVGVTSIPAANLNTLKDLVRFHLLNDTVSTGQFTDGKLATPTMYGQYLVTGAAFINGISSYTVNRQASMLRSNIKVGNGIIHVIDRMLTPAARTIAQQLEANPDYSVFVQAMKETGYYTMLNTVDADTSKRWLTVIAETNKALADSGYHTYAALKAKYSQTGNPANPKDSLHMYMAYHIMSGLYFLGDIINFSTQLTLLPEEVMSIKLENQNIVLNENEFNGVLEKGVLLDRPTSDNSATNGVWHTATGHTMAKYRKPTAVYWDVAMFPEIMNQPAYFRKAYLAFNRPTAADRPVASIDWEYNTNTPSINYEYGGTGTLNIYNVFWDHISFHFGNNRAKWIEFTSPPIIKGKYKVWICYVAQNSVGADVLINGVPMQRSINFNEYMPAGTPEERESIGWKNYTTAANPNRHNGRLVGIVDILTTGKQVVRFQYNGTGGQICRLDMIHFIPVEENQIYPRFGVDGAPSWQ